MDNKQQYLQLLTEIIKKQAVILGPDIALLKARSIVGIKVSDDCSVTDIVGDPKEVIQKLINSYVELSGQIVKSALGSIFEKYPSINKID
jgi:hypothetical protein